MWRDTGRPVMVVFLDARACFPLLVFVVYWSWTTFYIAATGVIVFSVISWAGGRRLATRCMVSGTVSAWIVVAVA